MFMGAVNTLTRPWIWKIPAVVLVATSASTCTIIVLRAAAGATEKIMFRDHASLAKDAITAVCLTALSP